MKEEGQLKHSRGLFLKATSMVSGETFHYLLQHTPKGRLGAALRALEKETTCGQVETAIAGLYEAGQA